MVEPVADPSSELDTFLGTAPVAPWRRWLLWLAIAAGVVMLGLLAMRFANGGQAASYVSSPVVLDDLPVSLAVTGTLEPSATSAAGTALTGVVREVLVAKDDRVVKGQLLARLDPRPFRNALATSRQRLAEAQGALAVAQDLERKIDTRLQLFQQVRRRSGGVAPSDREMQQAQADLASARDAVKMAETVVKSARLDVAAMAAAVPATAVRSPIDGVIAQTTARVGQKLGPTAGGAMLFVIAAPYSHLDLHAPVDPENAAKLPPGASAQVTVADLPSQVFPGKLRDDATARAGGGRLVLEVTSSGQFLRPGMTATARLALDVHRNVLIVPNAVLQFARASDARRGTAGGGAVYVLDSDGAPRRVPVTAVATDGSRTEIAPGPLTPGTRVILGLR